MICSVSTDGREDFPFQVEAIVTLRSVGRSQSRSAIVVTFEGESAWLIHYLVVSDFHNRYGVETGRVHNAALDRFLPAFLLCLGDRAASLGCAIHESCRLRGRWQKSRFDRISVQVRGQTPPLSPSPSRWSKRQRFLRPVRVFMRVSVCVCI